jgi:hypothetical protein
MGKLRVLVVDDEVEFADLSAPTSCYESISPAGMIMAMIFRS